MVLEPEGEGEIKPGKIKVAHGTTEARQNQQISATSPKSCRTVELGRRSKRQTGTDLQPYSPEAQNLPANHALLTPVRSS
jgi:hypothetical protein